jgi:hypothetical protein
MRMMFYKVKSVKEVEILKAGGREGCPHEYTLGLKRNYRESRGVVP